MQNDRPTINSDIDHLQFSIAPKWLMRRKELSPFDKLVYIRLRNCTHKMGDYWVSQEYLSYECGISLKSVKRSIETLIEVGLISKIQHGKKMFNSYLCHQHEWMTDDNRYEKSEGSDRPITQSDRSDRPLVTGQIDLSIYKEQNKKQNISLNSSERWKEFSKPFENKSKTGDCDKKLNRLSEKEFALLLKQRDAYFEYVKSKRKTWSDFPMKNASTFLTPKYWKEAVWEQGNKAKKNKSIYEINFCQI